MVEEVTKSCVHMPDITWCAICTPRENEWSKRKREETELDEKYENLKAKFKNFREDWTEDEIFIVYNTFINLKGRPKKVILETAIQLERTKNAVVWMWMHIFSKRKDLHRGKEVLRFRENLKLF